MKNSLLFVTIAVAGLSLSACDKAKREENEALEKKADAKEETAKAVLDAGSAQAHADKADAELKAEQLKKEAAATREQKQ